MPSFIKVISWSLTGALLGGTLMFFGFLVYHRLFDPSTDDSVRGFQAGQEIMGGVGGAGVGLAFGAMIGFFRIHSDHSSRPANTSGEG